MELKFVHRSAPEGMNVMNVIQWISMLQEVQLTFMPPSSLITYCERCTRSLTTTTWSARRSWSARWWGSPSTSATCPPSWSLASSKSLQQDSHILGIFTQPAFQDGALPWGAQHARWLQGATGRVPGRLREIWGPEGLRRVLPVPLLNQGLCQEELLRKLPVEETPPERLRHF